jgi:hypothetical protein
MTWNSACDVGFHVRTNVRPFGVRRLAHSRAKRGVPLASAERAGDSAGRDPPETSLVCRRTTSSTTLQHRARGRRSVDIPPPAATAARRRGAPTWPRPARRRPCGAIRRVMARRERLRARRCDDVAVSYGSSNGFHGELCLVTFLTEPGECYRMPCLDNSFVRLVGPSPRSTTTARLDAVLAIPSKPDPPSH